MLSARQVHGTYNSKPLTLFRYPSLSPTATKCWWCGGGGYFHVPYYNSVSGGYLENKKVQRPSHPYPPLVQGMKRDMPYWLGTLWQGIGGCNVGQPGKLLIWRSDVGCIQAYNVPSRGHVEILPSSIRPSTYDEMCDHEKIRFCF